MNSQFESSEFYSRQTVLFELGIGGQKKLEDSKVTVVGLGGLGSTSALFLALAGVGELTLVDQGNVAVFKSPETACLECVLPGLEDTELPTCDTRGVVGATTGIVGAIQAMETIKVLAGIEPQSKGRLMVFDFAQSEFRTVELKVRNDCQVCQVKSPRDQPYRRRLAWLCGSSTANVNPEMSMALDLGNLSRIIGRDHAVLLATPMVVVFDYNGHEVSLFKKGRMLIKNVQSEDEALQVSRAVTKMVDVGRV